MPQNKRKIKVSSMLVTTRTLSGVDPFLVFSFVHGDTDCFVLLSSQAWLFCDAPRIPSLVIPRDKSKKKNRRSFLGHCYSVCCAKLKTKAIKYENPRIVPSLIVSCLWDQTHHSHSNPNRRMGIGPHYLQGVFNWEKFCWKYVWLMPSTIISHWTDMKVGHFVNTDKPIAWLLMAYSAPAELIYYCLLASVTITCCWKAVRNLSNCLKHSSNNPLDKGVKEERKAI